MKYFRSRPRILTLAVAATFAFVLSGCVWSSTGAPRIVADTSATLTGAVKSSQDDTVTYWFKYGTTPDYGSTTTTQTAGVRKGTNGVSELVDGLTAGTTYHYRLCSDVPDHLPPACGADQVVTTTTGHDSVHGQGAYSYTEPPCPPTGIDCYDAFSILAAVDPNSSAIEGDLTFEGLLPGTPANPVQIRYTGVGYIQCLRVSGNIAVVGFSETITSDVGTFFAQGGLVIEDNGTTGDRYLTSYWSPISACPTPSPSLFNSGTPHSGDFVVSDG